MKFKEKKSIHYYYIISPLYVYMLLLFFALNQLLVSALIVTSAPGGSPSRQLSSSSSALNHNVSNNINKNSLNNTSSNRSANTAEPLAVVSKKFGNKLSGNWTYLPQVPPVSSAAQPYHMVATNHRSLASHHFNGSSSSLTIQQGSPTKYPSLKVLNGDFKKKICIGTSNRLSKLQNKDHHYQNIRDRYTNCTYVDGNLEITWLQHDVDLSFLDSIREVTGYVLIAYVNVAKIKMHNLQIIRGRELFSTLSMSEDKYALLVAYSDMRNLEMPRLRDILIGSVGIFESPNMCHIKSIYWEEILSGPNAKTFYYYNNTVPTENCPCVTCDHGCWSEEPQMCQEMKGKSCNPLCQRRGCYGSQPTAEGCCHVFCAGGCTGPTNSHCLACRNFDDDGVCKNECPSLTRYNVTTFSWEPNPEGKYAYGAKCVKNCPDHLLRDNGACVKACPPNKRNAAGECLACVGPCPKNCQGVENVNSGNIESFRGCTQIEGSITILDTSFSGYAEVHPNMTLGAIYRPLRPSELEVFSTLREITGFLNIQANHSDFKDLSCFRNLERIEGRQTTDMFTTLNILKTSLVSLNLRSLKHIRSGRVAIVENPDLCFADTLKWDQIANVSDVSKDIKIKLNAESSKCKSRGLVCHEQCSQDGCWGPQSDECLTCKNFKLDGRCVKDCQSDPISSYDAGNSTCKRCHEECANGCTGPESRHCRKCKNVRDGPYCVHECPISKYNSSGSCLPCHESCASGCTGPMNKTGPLGCNSCQKTVLRSSDLNIVDYCIKLDDQCPVGYYSDQKENRITCRKCHHRCKTCTAMGTHVSVCECSAYELGENCDVGCPRDYYADGKRCVRCSLSCNGCRGPTEADCLACRQFRVYSPDNSSLFTCTEHCPKDKPFRIIQNAGDLYCSDKDNISELLPDYGVSNTQSTAMILSIIIVSLVLFFAYKCQRARSEENTAKLTMRMTKGLDDDEPLHRSNIEPNLAQLNIILESDLRVGKKLGAGIGGIVYQGQWIESGENGETLGKNKSNKRLVAIKVLRDESQSNTNTEFLEEAKLMASVNHPNLVKLLAVCMTSRLMLITELMPLGCLSEYVRSYKDNIRPLYLLEWCSQIAKGMAYLEEKKIVHRDLALRNVLVQTPSRVLIADFGLAKLLDDDKGEYQSIRGKLPVRWLAPECLHMSVFTHKSDVWAFGVTVWELLTFGMTPYSNVETKNIPNEVKRGLRLKQPENASIEVAFTMAKCWMPPEDRPSFDELVRDFSKYRRDPLRYLVDSYRPSGYENYPNLSDSDMLAEERSLNSQYPFTPCDNPAFNFVKSPRKPMNRESQTFTFSEDHINNYKKTITSYNMEPRSPMFDISPPYHGAKRYLTDFDYNNNNNFSFPRTPIKAGAPTDDLNIPADDDDYVLPSYPMDVNGINNPEYHLKYNYYQYSKPSTSDDSSSNDQVSESNSYTKPDETAV